MLRVDFNRKTELTTVAKVGDELWLGVKG